MTPRIADALDTALASLRADQERGIAPPPGAVTQAEIARRAGLSEASIRNIEQVAIAKLAAGLLRQGDLPPRVTAALRNYLSR